MLCFAPRDSQCFLDGANFVGSVLRRELNCDSKVDRSSRPNSAFIATRLCVALVVVGGGIVAANLVLSSANSSSGVLVAGAIPLLITFAVLMTIDTFRSLQSRRRAQNIHRGIGESTVVDAHVDDNLLAALRQVWPELGRLVESDALARIITLSIGRAGLQLWTGSGPREAASVRGSAVVGLASQFAELGERTYPALRVAIDSGDKVCEVKFVLSRSGSSGMRKLRSEEIDQLIRNIKSDEQA